MQIDPHLLDWRIINDGVMGGISHSQLQIDDDGMRFHGSLSTENYGGFTSVLGELDRPLRHVACWRLQVSGDQRRYQLRLRENDDSRTVAWRSFFLADRTPRLVLRGVDSFEPVVRGAPVIGTTGLEQVGVRFIGFMLTSKEPGPFDLRIHSIEALKSMPDGNEIPW